MDRETYYQNPLLCDRCQKIIPYEKRRYQTYGKTSNVKYCNNSCSVLSTNPYRFTSAIRHRVGMIHKQLQPKIWTKQKRKEHSEKMRSVVNANPDSYSSQNVCGRVKSIKLIDSYGNETNCLGKWELLVAEYLNKKNIKWTNKIDDVFEYWWNGSSHRYFPDFKLTEKDSYIEVKGYERDRDRAKWNQFSKRLHILKLNEIKQIKDGKYIDCF